MEGQPLRAASVLVLVVCSLMQCTQKGRAQEADQLVKYLRLVLKSYVKMVTHKWISSSGKADRLSFRLTGQPAWPT